MKTRRMYRGENEMLEGISRLGNLVELLDSFAAQRPPKMKPTKEQAAYIEAASHARVAMQELVEADVELAKEELNG